MLLTLCVLLTCHNTMAHTPTGIPSGWHVEARGLSSGRLYSLTSQHGLSDHSHSLDASQCSTPPRALRPGSMWSVITAAEPYQDMALYAQLLAQVGLGGSMCE